MDDASYFGRALIETANLLAGRQVPSTILPEHERSMGNGPDCFFACAAMITNAYSLEVSSISTTKTKSHGIFAGINYDPSSGVTIWQVKDLGVETFLSKLGLEFEIVRQGDNISKMVEHLKSGKAAIVLEGNHWVVYSGIQGTFDGNSLNIIKLDPGINSVQRLVAPLGELVNNLKPFEFLGGIIQPDIIYINNTARQKIEIVPLEL